MSLFLTCGTRIARAAPGTLPSPGPGDTSFGDFPEQLPRGRLFRVIAAACPSISARQRSLSDYLGRRAVWWPTAANQSTHCGHGVFHFCFARRFVTLRAHSTGLIVRSFKVTSPM